MSRKYSDRNQTGWYSGTHGRVADDLLDYEACDECVKLGDAAYNAAETLAELDEELQSSEKEHVARVADLERRLFAAQVLVTILEWQLTPAQVEVFQTLLDDDKIDHPTDDLDRYAERAQLIIPSEVET